MLELPTHPPLGTPEMDAQYNNRELVPEHVGLYEKWAPMCADVVADFPCHQGVAYGSSPREIMDIVLPPEGHSPDAPHPVLVYIHGGYWMSRSITDQTFLARAYAEAGIAFVLVEYDLIPGVRMADIIRQCRQATQWVHDHAGDYGLDANRIFVGGHSAGGHLTAALAATDWPTFSGGPKDLMKGGIALSGIYDLAPIQQSYMQETLALTDDEVAADSPQFFDPTPTQPLIVAPGGGESDAFKHQSRNLVNTWNAKGADCRYLEPDGCNHFTILSDFANPESELAQATMAMVLGKS
ncbi:MAG: alpha/beta hydrolase [Rhodospirillaceae bacterium]|nr:alpha/beta hydrolase [Rhodospirillaceae bacterium]